MAYRKSTNFVYTDLSSYDTAASRRFYTQVFGWEIHNTGKAAAESGDRFGMDQVSYSIATKNNKAAAGIYDMPPFFQKINMPPFWMSYLAVDDIDGVVARAKATDGVIVDIEPTPFGDGMMALIRDPQGAGFTCYDGPDIDSKNDGSEYGRMVWNELITASIAKVAPFYRDVLGLKVLPYSDRGSNYAKLINRASEEIAGIQEVDSSIRGEKVYWLPFFSVDTVDEFTPRAIAAGGKILSDSHGSALFYDNTGAAFGVTETGADFSKARPWYQRLFG